MYWNGRKVVVTGAGGFIGSHLVEQLLKDGAIVTAIVRYNSKGFDGWIEDIDPVLKTNLTVFRMHLHYNDSLTSILKEKEVVFNLAAHIGIPYSYINPQEVIQNNITSTLNLLLAARSANVKKFIQTSTSEVFGTAKQIPIPETHVLQPQSPYSASKIATDSMALSFYYSFGMPITIVRPFNTFGPRQSTRAIIPSLISQALQYEHINAGITSTTRDFTYVADTVRGFMMIAESEDTIGQAFNLGTGVEYSIDEVIKKIVSLTHTKAEVRLDQTRIRPENSEVQRLCSDNTKVRNCVGWESKTNFDEGLERTIAWIASHIDLFKSNNYSV